MPMDEYDDQHTIKPVKTINVYKNLDVTHLIDSFIDSEREGYTPYEDEDFKERFLDTVRDLQSALAVLERRTITSISARILCGTRPKPQWYVVRVWRGLDYSVYNTGSDDGHE